MSYPENFKYTEEHEWINPGAADSALFGITDFAQSELGEIVFVELPEAGSEFARGDSICVVESTKAASDVYAPVACKVLEVNSALAETPGLVNDSPHKDGWLLKIEIQDTDELDEMMDSAQYDEFVEEKS